MTAVAVVLLRDLAERWELRLRLRESVACHHRPDLAQDAKREAA